MLVKPCDKPSPSITAQHELAFALQAPLPPYTFISHRHSKGPHLCQRIDLDHSCFHLLLSLLFFLVLQKSLIFTSSSSPSSLISSALHPFTLFLLQSPTALKPFLSRYYAFTYFMYFPWAQVSCPFHCTGFPHLYPFPINVCPISLMHHSIFPSQSSIFFSTFQHMCKHCSISQVPL